MLKKQILGSKIHFFILFQTCWDTLYMLMNAFLALEVFWWCRHTCVQENVIIRAFEFFIISPRSMQKKRAFLKLQRKIQEKQQRCIFSDVLAFRSSSLLQRLNRCKVWLIFSLLIWPWLTCWWCFFAHLPRWFGTWQVLGFLEISCVVLSSISR